MIIHPPSPATETEVTLDVAKGAVTFDPWPFNNALVDLVDGAYMASGQVLYRGQWALGKLNTLATATDGRPVVMTAETWRRLVEETTA